MTLFMSWLPEDRLLALGREKFVALCLSHGTSREEAELYWSNLQRGRGPLGLSREGEPEPLSDGEAAAKASSIAEDVRKLPSTPENDAIIKQAEEVEKFFGDRVKAQASKHVEAILRRTNPEQFAGEAGP